MSGNIFRNIAALVDDFSGKIAAGNNFGLAVAEFANISVKLLTLGAIHDEIGDEPATLQQQQAIDAAVGSIASSLASLAAGQAAITFTASGAISGGVALTGTGALFLPIIVSLAATGTALATYNALNEAGLTPFPENVELTLADLDRIDGPYFGSTSDDMLIIPDSGAEGFRVSFGLGDDSVVINGGQNIVLGGFGDDTVDYSGLTGDQGIIVSDLPIEPLTFLGLVISESIGLRVEGGSSTLDGLADFEILIGTDQDDTFLLEGLGLERIESGAGVDRFFDPDGVIEIDGGEGLDAILASADEVLNIESGSSITGIEIFIGNASDDSLNFTSDGNGESDLGTTIDLGEGSNTLDGAIDSTGDVSVTSGEGDDTLSLSLSGGVIALLAGGGTNTITLDGSVGGAFLATGDGDDTFNLTLSGTDDLILLSGDGNDTLTVDYSVSGLPSSVILGGAGNDTITISGSNSIVIGGAGEDVLILSLALTV